MENAGSKAETLGETGEADPAPPVPAPAAPASLKMRKLKAKAAFLKPYERIKKTVLRRVRGRKTKKARSVQTDAPSSQELMDVDYETTASAGPSTSADSHPRAMFYKMNRRDRGMALIFNHGCFEVAQGLQDRPGTDHDCIAMVCLLQELGLQVHVFHDCTRDELLETLASVSEVDHTHHDCLVVVVLTHGDDGGILHARDSPYKRNRLWERFTADACQTLAGKPKLFFIQACQGTAIMGSAPAWGLEMDNSQTFRGNRMPSHADILIACSTIQGFVSVRHPDEGTPFIRTLVEEMKKKAHRHDLVSILTYVNNRVAREVEHYIHKGNNVVYLRQMPCYESALTKFVKFRKKENDFPEDRVANGRCVLPENCDKKEDLLHWTAMPLEKLIDEDSLKLQHVLEVEIVNVSEKPKNLESLYGIMPKLHRLAIRGKEEHLYPKHKISSKECKERWLELQDIDLNHNTSKELIRRHGHYLNEIRLWVNPKKRGSYPWIWGDKSRGLDKLLKDCCFRKGKIILRSFYEHSEKDCHKALQISSTHCENPEIPVDVAVSCEIYKLVQPYSDGGIELFQISRHDWERPSSNSFS